jgi:retinol dehydrogenase-14
VNHKHAYALVYTELRKETGYSGGEVMTIDQSDFASVSAFATEFREKHDRLDVLVANAGVYLFERIRTKDGWESSFVYPR